MCARKLITIFCLFFRNGWSATAGESARDDGCGWPGSATVEYATADAGAGGAIDETDAEPAEYDGWTAAVFTSTAATVLGLRGKIYIIYIE